MAVRIAVILLAEDLGVSLKKVEESAAADLLLYDCLLYGSPTYYYQGVVERYLDCGNPPCGFARIRCPDCGRGRLLMFSCRTGGFCPSCHAERLDEWGEWKRKKPCFLLFGHH